VRHENGQVEIEFSSPKSNTPQVFTTRINMTTHVESLPTVPQTKHIWYDVCKCSDCLDEPSKLEMDKDIPKSISRSQRRLKKQYRDGDPTVGLGEPSCKFDYYVIYPDKTSNPIPPPPSNQTPQRTMHDWKIKKSNFFRYYGYTKHN
jgi:hypothetical protein